MARLGLGARWECVFANDICPKKVAAYRRVFDGAPELIARDIRSLHAEQLPNGAMLAWASFPCQDLSLAGKGRGLQGSRSSTFWPFLDLILAKKGFAEIPILVIENVVGAITSNGGNDIAAILEALKRGGYRFGPLVIDAKAFVPQSRPRLFIIAISKDIEIPRKLIRENPCDIWHKSSLIQACRALPRDTQDCLIWWRLAFPDQPPPLLSDLLEDNPRDVKWHSASETQTLLNMMSAPNLDKVRSAQACGTRRIGTLYKRTRIDECGEKSQRAEVRFDDVSGCLRTPAGGSSRQTILEVNGQSIRSRLLSPREAARLMGVPDCYPLPRNYNDAYKLMGDGLVVPVVSWLETHLLAPLARTVTRSRTELVA